jgi:hypothetical protein|eukprot:COSAG02_NODE_100_length_36897_cov_9.681749_8_plen_142_part_00
MVEPVSAGTIIGGLRVASEAQRWLSDEDRGLRFGFSYNPEEERRCPQLDVFLTSVGTVAATTTRHRLVLPASSTPLQARDALSKEVGARVEQEDIKDGKSSVQMRLLVSVIDSICHDMAPGLLHDCTWCLSQSMVSRSARI